MYKLCVFAGTTEGRKLIDFLTTQQVVITACVATEYGETLLQPAERLTVSAKRLTEGEMADLFQKEQFDLVIDATHPYAQMVTENIEAACDQTGRPYLRLLRKESQTVGDEVFVPDIAGAVEYLNTTEGNILLTTGSKELTKYLGLKHFAHRVFARVLPMDASLQACREAGLQPSHIIAMQGPFSEEMNLAMLRSIGAAALVTKDSGSCGGFREKATAARKAGAKLVVIGRPAQRDGMDLPEMIDFLCEKFCWVKKPEVAVVGIGLGNPETMTLEARHTISRADCLIGAERMLEAVALPGQTVFEAVAPGTIAEYIRSHGEFQRFAVVMSGDVGFYSGTKKLLPLLRDYNTRLLPGISSMVAFCAKLGISYEEVKPVSLHGRKRNLAADVRSNEAVFALVGGDEGVRDLCRSLTDAGLGQVTVSVGQRLSYPEEKIVTAKAEDLLSETFDRLSVVLIRNPNPDGVVTHGLPDSAFLRVMGEDCTVPMTKSEVRSVCLSKLALTERSICWDVGAGTGSVAIEMAIQASKGHVYAIEKKPEAVELLRRNGEAFGMDRLTVVEGIAPEACQELPAPTHVFLGGSSGNLKEILTLALDKNPQVRIVATAIALETIGELTTCCKDFDRWESVCLNVSRDRKAGPYHLMTANNPVYIFTMQNGGNAR